MFYVFCVVILLCPRFMVGMNDDQAIPVNDDNNRLMIKLIEVIERKTNKPAVEEILGLVPADPSDFINHYPVSREAIRKWNDLRRASNLDMIPDNQENESFSSIYNHMVKNARENNTFEFFDVAPPGSCCIGPAILAWLLVGGSMYNHVAEIANFAEDFGSDFSVIFYMYYTLFLVQNVEICASSLKKVIPFKKCGKPHGRIAVMDVLKKHGLQLTPENDAFVRKEYDPIYKV